MAIEKPLPGELSYSEAIKLIDDVRDFGRPYPVLIFTGGDPLIRSDILELISYSKNLGIPVAIAPTASDILTSNVMKRLSDVGVSAISISIDGTQPEIHDSIRGIPGHLERSVSIIKELKDYGFKLQINTAVMRDNLLNLADMVRLLIDLEVNIWEVFFLIHVGRGTDVQDITPPEYEDVMHFLYDVSEYDITVRTVEAPFFRRVVIWRKKGRTNNRVGSLYYSLRNKLLKLVGEPYSVSRAQTLGTRDGKGVIFIAYNGDVYPSGFAPFRLGNVKNEHIARIYRDNRILRLIRKGVFAGRCGICEYKDICGGSRARALATYGDILAEDPSCIYIPRNVLVEHTSDGVIN
jgi:radical SAM protein